MMKTGLGHRGSTDLILLNRLERALGTPQNGNREDWVGFELVVYPLVN